MGTSVNGKNHFMTPLVDEKAISSNGKIGINSKFIGNKKLATCLLRRDLSRFLIIVEGSNVSINYLDWRMAY